VPQTDGEGGCAFADRIRIGEVRTVEGLVLSLDMIPARMCSPEHSAIRTRLRHLPLLTRISFQKRMPIHRMFPQDWGSGGETRRSAPPPAGEAIRLDYRQRSVPLSRIRHSPSSRSSEHRAVSNHRALNRQSDVVIQLTNMWCGIPQGLLCADRNSFKTEATC